MEMREEVHSLLRQRGETPVVTQFVNNNRCYLLETDFRAYLCKWQDEPFKAAGEKVPGLKKGWGVSIDLGTYLNFAKTYPDGWVLQNWSGTNTIYYAQREWMDIASEVYEQENGEFVRVISIKDIKALKPIIN
jgi:hypothetical protein